MMTKGPWKVECLETERHGYPGWNTFTVRSPQNVCLATIGEVDRYHEKDAEANARAIAQVPAMVETLTELEACFGDGKGHLETRLYAVREKAHAILRAVEGKP